MSYPYLQYGDKLPAVGVIQKLLNQTRATLTVDGIYGSRTRAAVIDFQRLCRLSPDGVVGENTWPRIRANGLLPVVDCIDVFDPSLSKLEAKDIRRAGGNPVVIGGMCNGVERAVSHILSKSQNIFLLRFHGHGTRGVASISTGHGELDPDMIHRGDISLSNLEDIRFIIARLRGVFGPYGCVQFMHCQTGGGVKGKILLRKIADILGVPVSAGVLTQYGGGLRTFRFEGETRTEVPRGGSLRSWCSKLPNPGLYSDLTDFRKSLR